MSRKIEELEKELEELKKKDFDVTVLIPTYNGSDTIQLVLTKGLMQQGINPKVIIMDNGSVDGTYEMLDTAIKNKWYGGLSIEIHKCERVDAEPKINKCLVRQKLAQMAKTKYTFWLDDDVLLPSFGIRQMLDEIIRMPKCGCLAMQYQAFTPHISIGATLMLTEVSNKIKWQINGREPCECNDAMDQIRKMNYDVMYFKRVMARELTHL